MIHPMVVRVNPAREKIIKRVRAARAIGRGRAGGEVAGRWESGCGGQQVPIPAGSRPHGQFGGGGREMRMEGGTNLNSDEFR